MKVLHLGFHKGLFNDFQYVSEQLGLDTEHLKFTDGETSGGAIYNIDHNLAKRAWNKYKDFYHSFDLIVVSDTCPISRVFLQNKYKGKLIIWICNRMDYSDKATNTTDFPDDEYYNLLRDTKYMDNVQVFSYTKFENIYAISKSVNIGKKIIKPCGFISKKFSKDKLSFKGKYKIPQTVNKSEMFFVPPYHNDTIMIDLSAVLRMNNIKNYCGKYDGPSDLVDFKGIIHIPYAWSNLSLFEAIQLGIIYFIPSLNFIKELSVRNSNFFWSPPYLKDYLNKSEWYCEEHQDIFVFFNSWADLKNKVLTTNYENKRNYILEFGKEHNNEMLELWKNALNI